MGPAITAHPLQLTFAAACADVYDVANLDGATRRGVAYLLRSDRAITAASVVRGRQIGQSLTLRFSAGVRSAILIAVDEEADCAVLEPRPAMVSQLALNLRRGLCQPGEACQSWASLPTLRSPGHLLQVLCDEPLGEDVQRGPALFLRVVAGHERWHPSLAGSPLLHNGFVVGHLRAVSEGSSRLLACPAPYIAALMPTGLDEAAPLPQPPKAAYSSAWYVARPDEERRALIELASAQPLLLWAPEGHGKTWFLRRILELIRAEGGAALYYNVERLGEPELRALPAVLEEALFAAQQLGVKPLLLALDRLDAILDTPFHDLFLNQLSALVEISKYDELFSPLRLALVSSTAPEWLTRPVLPEPASLPRLPVVTLALEDFSLEMLLTLAKLHGLAPTAAELAALQAIVGGHPYLSRVAMYAAASRGITLGELLESSGPTIFDPYVEACRRRIAAQPGLWPTLELVLRERPLTALDRLLLPRLERMGIVRCMSLPDGLPTCSLRSPIYCRILEL